MIHINDEPSNLAVTPYLYMALKIKCLDKGVACLEQTQLISIETNSIFRSIERLCIVQNKIYN